MSETLAILKQLIEIPSYVDGGSDERNLVVFIKNFFETRTSYKVISQEVEGERQNLLVYKKKTPKLCLFGHMDTVLPKPESETPFVAREMDGMVYGLGAVDMKAGLAIMLSLALEYENDDLSFVFSVDEEFDFKGALKLKEIKDFQPKFIINVEPTDNKIINGCRGICEFSFKVFGKSAHAGRKELGVNAIEKAVDLVKKFQGEITKIDIEDGGRSSVNLAYIHGGMLKNRNDKEVEISKLGNVVPNYAELNCEIRIANPIIDKNYIEKELIKLGRELGIKVDDFVFKFMLGSMYTNKDDLKTFEKSLSDNNIAVVYGDISMAGYYEVQMLQEMWDGKAIVFGPGPNEMSHKQDEFVEIKSIENTEKCLVSFIKENI